MLRKRKMTWIVVFQKLHGMPQSGLTKYLATGKIQEELIFWGGIFLQYDYYDLYKKIISDFYTKIIVIIISLIIQ